MKLARAAAGALAAFVTVCALAQAPQLGQVSKDSVWVPTPERMIRRMLQIADTTKDDLVIDLGSGDGRIPIHAARHFGARAIGVELEGNLVKLSREAAKTSGVAHLTEFLQQDLYEADLSKATVIALYISPPVMTQLAPRLMALSPGTRVVSHQFRLDDWEPDESIFVEGRSGFLWVVPADARGAWTVRVAGDMFRVHIGQTHQKLEARGERAGKAIHVISARLRGNQITFTAFDADGGARYYEGRIEGSRMSGSSGGASMAQQPWAALRD